MRELAKGFASLCGRFFPEFCLGKLFSIWLEPAGICAQKAACKGAEMLSCQPCSCNPAHRQLGQIQSEFQEHCDLSYHSPYTEPAREF